MDELEREFGPAVPLVIPLRDYFTWGSSEPEEARELESMAVEDIVSLLAGWGPSDGDPRRSPDRFGRRLTQAIANDPEKFARDAQRFQQVDPTYIRHAFQGFRQALALKEPRLFTWDNVISLCDWVVSQGREIVGRAVKTFYWDENWANSRREILDLVDAGLRNPQGGIPFHLRDRLWCVLKPLTTDPEPTTEDEIDMLRERQDPAPLVGEGFTGFGHHPGDMAINGVRCLAITTVVSYGMWVRRNMCQTEIPDQGPKPGFEEMPEVREVLDYHLEPQNDSSIGVAYVYGREFRSLYVLDSDWAQENKARIFSRAEGLRERGAAAWEGFLLNGPTYSDAFTVLEEQYAQAVEELGRPASETGHFVNLDLRLGQRLCELYLSAKIPLGTPGSIWERFFEKAGDEVVGKLILSIGWTLFEKEASSGQWLDKLRILWECRLRQIALDGDATKHRNELRAFGPWFGSGKFDSEWALTRLREVLVVNSEVEAADRVVNRLALLVTKFPVRAVECTILLVREATKHWMLDSWREDLQRIVSAARNTEDQQVLQKCKELKNILVSKGLTEFA